MNDHIAKNVTNKHNQASFYLCKYSLQYSANVEDATVENVQTEKTVLRGLFASKCLFSVAKHLAKGCITNTSSYSTNNGNKVAPCHSNREIGRQCITVGEILGKGNGGIVYKGEFTASFAPGTKKQVAIKTINNEASCCAIQCFVAEIKMMRMLDFHCNLVNMIGIHTQGVLEKGEALMILEYCNEKDLLTLLSRNKKQITKSLNTVSESDQLFHSRLLVTLAVQIARGMEYLASKRIMHGDLAARNILLHYDKNCSKNIIAKVADFGLSKHIVNKVYNKKNRNYVPWKWMAYEFLENNIFTMKSDVWSYGVLIWEMFSLGREPYEDIDDWKELKEELRRKNYLQCPKEILTATTNGPSKEIYIEIARMCFVNEERDRSSFSDILRLLSLCLTNEELKQYEFSSMCQSVTISPIEN